MIIKSIIDKRTPNRSGKYPVKIIISDKGKRKYITLGLFADISEFNDETGFFIVSAKNKENTQKNNLISTTLSQINDLVIQLRQNRKQITYESIINLYNELYGNVKEKEQVSFNEYFRKQIETKQGRTKEVYANTLKKIEKYFGNELSFEEINKSWLKAFIQKMRNEKINRKGDQYTGLSLNAQSINLRNIRAIFNEAIDDRIVSLDLYPFRKFTIEQEEVKHRAIPVEDLRKVFEYTGTESENFARDVAKLIFFLIGINGNDLFNLSEPQKGYINYRRSKTNRLYSIKVEPEIAELFDKFKGENNFLCFGEVFSTVNNFFRKVNGQTAYKNGEKIVLKRGLNTIGETLGIDKLTTYTFRHTWATIAASLDIPKDTIAAALGHGKKSVTDIYIDFDQKKIDEANRRVINYVFM